MKVQASIEKTPAPAAGWQILLTGAVLVLAALAAYSNSFSGPFIFDDLPAIAGNRTIRHLESAWSPPPLTTASGRPVLNFSLALNYATGGLSARGYHVFNLVIHILAGLVLFGLARRTLLYLQNSTFKIQSSATGLAFCMALLWTLHPLQTEAVTYVVQRAESLMGLFYLLTLYCFARYANKADVRDRKSEVRKNFAAGFLTSDIWLPASVLCCLAGMATKEVMVSAPVMVFLYDRTFVAGSFREAWIRRRRYYAALAGTWLLLGYLLWHIGGNRGDSSGFGLGWHWWCAYWLTQFRAVTHYLRLTFWPHPLVFDYGTEWAERPADVIPYALILIPLAVGAAIALWRRPVVGFLGFWFFAILAPTSIVPGKVQMIVEHRMYLPLAAVIAGALAGLVALAGRRSLLLCLGLAAPCLAGLTYERNKDYRSAVAIWSDTVAKRPNNAWAHNSLGSALNDAGRTDDAITQFKEALKLKPDYAEARCNLGAVYVSLGRVSEAIEQYRQALQLEPSFAQVHSNLGVALAKLGRADEALKEYKEAVRLDPDFAVARNNLGNALLWSGQNSAAIEQYEEAVRLDPNYAEAQNNLGNALFKSGRVAEAADRFKQVVQLLPNDPAAHYNFGMALAMTGRVAEAETQFTEALRLKPDYAAARENLEKLQSLQR